MEKETFNQQAGIPKELIEYLAEVFDHPSKINEAELIHGKEPEEGGDSNE